MRNKRLIQVVFLILISVIWTSESYSLLQNTHKAINEEVAKRVIGGFSLDSYLKNQLGFKSGIEEEFLKGSDKKLVFKWLGYGGIQEDEPGSLDYLILNMARANNHYHNPLKPWNGAGLNDKLPVLGWYTGQSSLLWSQNRNQLIGGQWSWPDAREVFYKALTNSSQIQRERYFADTFRAVGQLMHLVEDASVPQHTRNDIHLTSWHYEYGVEKIRTNETEYPYQWNDWMNNPISFDKAILDIPSDHPNAPVPISRIIDTDKYDRENPDPDITTDKVCSINTSIACNIDSDCPEPQKEKCNVSTIGMSEYSNANFLSEDTMFTDGFDQNDRHYFPYPSRAAVSLWTDGTNNRQYLKKEGEGETINHLAAAGFLFFYRWKYFPQEDKHFDVWLDEKCYEDYASLLVPRAIGYSAGLLDYFFRGKINIVQTGFVQIDAGFFQSFQIVNLSDEDIEGNLSSFRLYYDNLNNDRYEIPLAFFDSTGGQYTDPNTVLSIPSQSKSLFKVVLQGTPVNPKSAGEYILVFKGRIGNEGTAPYDTEYAVAGQLITPHFLTHADCRRSVGCIRI